MSAEFFAFFGGRWVPQSQVRIEIDDIGFLQSATAVERLRTWGLRLPPLSDHLERFIKSTATLKISDLPAPEQIAEIICGLLEHNRPEIDVGVTLFATPGRRGANQSTFCAHLTTLNLVRIERLQTAGQSLVVTDIQQPPPESWPRGIKVRSRLHYHLADLQAREKVEDGLGVLLDLDGSITETSTSNILICNGKTICMPPEDRVLPGVMAKRVCAKAISEGFQFERRSMAASELLAAEEVWLTGSEVGLWYASQVDGQPKPPAVRCLALQSQLQKDWTSNRWS